MRVLSTYPRGRTDDMILDVLFISLIILFFEVVLKYFHTINYPQVLKDPSEQEQLPQAYRFSILPWYQMLEAVFC